MDRPRTTMGEHSLLGRSIPNCLSCKGIVASGESRCIGTAAGRGGVSHGARHLRVIASCSCAPQVLSRFVFESLGLWTVAWKRLKHISGIAVDSGDDIFVGT